ncbi:MAG: hypothetical protein IJT01_03115 [Selenomonadaceae bacterium]|nr:hypothetical protein [Selenomonadaceae bacterium]
MYKSQKDHQIAFDDFNQSCGMQLDMSNQWVCLARSIPWGRLEEKYARMFPSKKGCPAKPLRMALGALIIQKRMNLSDRKRLDREFMEAANELFLASAEATPEHQDKKSSKPATHPATESGNGVAPNAGTAILDATCSPSNIN